MPFTMVTNVSGTPKETNYWDWIPGALIQSSVPAIGRHRPAYLQQGHKLDNFPLAICQVFYKLHMVLTGECHFIITHFQHELAIGYL